MSETTTAAPAPAAAPIPDAGAATPPPNSQPAISVSEAARLLNRQRQEGRPPTPAAPPQGRQPAPNAVAAAAANDRAATDAKPATPPPAPANGLSAMERALGVPGAAPPPADVATATPQDATGLELEGRRYSAAELREAVLKSADYTAKTQQLAQQRQAVQAQQEALAAVLPYIQPELARLAETVQNAPARPDPALLETDPQAYLRARAAYETAMEEQGRLNGLTVLQQQAQARAMEQAVATANEQLAREFPFWADPAERSKAQAELVAWATTDGGFNRDELRHISSAHHLKTMMKAAQYDKWVKASRTQAPPTLAAPARGAAPPPPPTALVGQATESFEAKPNARTGAALLAARRAAQAQSSRS